MILPDAFNGECNGGLMATEELVEMQRLTV